MRKGWVMRTRCKSEAGDEGGEEWEEEDRQKGSSYWVWLRLPDPE